MPVCAGGSSPKSAWRRCGAYMVSPGLPDCDMIAQPVFLLVLSRTLLTKRLLSMC